MNDVLTSLSLPLADVGAAMFLLFAAGITAMTGVAFVFWIGWIALRGIVAIVSHLSIWPGRRSQAASSAARHACPDPLCRRINPSHARFCRHCGRMLRNATAAA